MTPPDALHQWLVCAGYSLLNSLVTFVGIGGLIHYWFYVRKRNEAQRWKLQPDRWLSRAMTRHAFLLGGLNQLLGVLLGGSFAWYLQRGGWSLIYFDARKYGLLYLPLSGLLGFLVVDAGLYYSHRLLHHRLLFRHIHRWHHRYVSPIVFTTTAVHPAEFFLFSFVLALPAFIVPMHVVVFVALVVYSYFIGIIDHMGARFPWKLPLHNNNQFHDDHHICFHCNFGHHTMLFDWLHGTVRRSDRDYGEHIYGGRGAARESAASGGRVVRY
jgi:lathosterol oxidase